MTQAITAKTTVAIPLPLKAAIRGTEIANRIEPKDTYFVIQTVMIQIESPAISSTGRRIAKTPMNVATPFPPLNFKNMVQLWPAITAKAKSALKRYKFIAPFR